MLLRTIRSLNVWPTFTIFAVGAALVVGPTGLPFSEALADEKMRRIGILRHHGAPDEADAAFVRGLRELGWIEGRNIAFEYRWAAGRRDLFPVLARELVGLDPEVIVVTTMSAVEAVRNATSTIPIVMGWGADAVENGAVASLARPGGNVTGLSEPYADINVKLLELLHMTLPGVTRVAVLWNPTVATYARTFEKVKAAAPVLGLTIQSLALQKPEELEGLLDEAARLRAGALIVMGRMYTRFGPQIGRFATEQRVPVFSVSKPEVEKHFGLLAYAQDTRDMFQRAATYVDRILKGAKPMDLPVQLPQKFTLVLNMRTAKALGIAIPPSILIRADELIR